MRNADFENPGLERDARFGGHWFVAPPVFGVALSRITKRIIPQFGRKIKVLSVFCHEFLRISTKEKGGFSHRFHRLKSREKAQEAQNRLCTTKARRARRFWVEIRIRESVPARRDRIQENLIDIYCLLFTIYYFGVAGEENG